MAFTNFIFFYNLYLTSSIICLLYYVISNNIELTDIFF